MTEREGISPRTGRSFLFQTRYAIPRKSVRGFSIRIELSSWVGAHETEICNDARSFSGSDERDSGFRCPPVETYCFIQAELVRPA